LGEKNKLIKIAYIITPKFGSTWAGSTHHILSTLSGWKSDEIKIDIIGTELKVLNLNSGNRNYILSGELWKDKHHKMTRFERLMWSIRIIFLIVTTINKYDIYQFMTIDWGGLISPLILHIFGKKAIFLMTRYDYNNPSFLAKTFKGRIAVKLLKKFDGIIGLAPAFEYDCKAHGFKNKYITLPPLLTLTRLENGKNLEDRENIRLKLNIPTDAPILLFVGSD